jgi:hypothetical protein
LARHLELIAAQRTLAKNLDRIAPASKVVLNEMSFPETATETSGSYMDV